jgi:hypothetical protein
MKYRINAPRIAFEHIQDETIIIDFESGTYFSISGIGCEIWELLSGGLDVSSIQQIAKRSFSGAATDIDEGIMQFVDELLQADLIRDAGESSPAASEEQVSPSAVKREYVRPILNRYTDMKDLLLLDPIHEVDDQGWPIQKKTP